MLLNCGQAFIRFNFVQPPGVFLVVKAGIFRGHQCVQVLCQDASDGMHRIVTVESLGHKALQIIGDVEFVAHSNLVLYNVMNGGVQNRVRHFDFVLQMVDLYQR
jgi:hypothetical protein